MLLLYSAVYKAKILLNLYNYKIPYIYIKSIYRSTGKFKELILYIYTEFYNLINLEMMNLKGKKHEKL